MKHHALWGLCYFYTAFATLLHVPSSANSETAPGTLDVSTTVPMSCSVVPPDGNLNLSVDRNKPLTTLEQPVSPAVEVTLTCEGKPRVTKASFGPGSASLDTVSSFEGVRAVVRSGGSAATPIDIIGYRLYADINSDFTVDDKPTSNGGNWMQIQSGFQTLQLDNDGSVTFYVRARIFEGNSTRAFASAEAIPSGTYSDVVTMTMDY